MQIKQVLLICSTIIVKKIIYTPLSKRVYEEDQEEYGVYNKHTKKALVRYRAWCVYNGSTLVFTRIPVFEILLFFLWHYDFRFLIIRLFQLLFFRLFLRFFFSLPSASEEKSNASDCDGECYVEEEYE